MKKSDVVERQSGERTINRNMATPIRFKIPSESLVCAVRTASTTASNGVPNIQLSTALRGLWSKSASMYTGSRTSIGMMQQPYTNLIIISGVSRVSLVVNAVTEVGLYVTL